MFSPRTIAIIGAGPAGLIAAEMLAKAGHAVSIYDRMPSPGRKFLIAGRGGLNLTHSEPLATFLNRYSEAAEWLTPAIQAFPPEALRAWCDGLGGESFVGSSGRVFPKQMKAVALLRAWLQRLGAMGVEYHPRHRWIGWDDASLLFETSRGNVRRRADATLLALGGASWPRLGSDGGWVSILESQNIPLAPLLPSNCGFLTAWSDYFRERFAGTPLKPVAVTHNGITHQGEAMITERGIEGGAIYALSPSIRAAILRDGATRITLDLRPAMRVEALEKKLSSHGNKSLSSFLKSNNFSAQAIALLHETTEGRPDQLAARLKALPITLTGIAGMERAISTAGGIRREALNAHYMLHAKPGVFAAGEMLDWEAPTGGYLLQACFSTGAAAANGILEYLSGRAR